jgi:hypothetical protein
MLNLCDFSFMLITSWVILAQENILTYIHMGANTPYSTPDRMIRDCDTLLLILIGFQNSELTIQSLIERKQKQ